MHMIDVLDKLKEIQENYDNEDIQRAIATAAKMNPVEEEAVAERKDITHDCVNHFEHKKFGTGTVISGEHTLSEDGEVSHYDAEFVRENGSRFIVRNIPVANIQEIISEKHHSHKKKMYTGKFDNEVVAEYDEYSAMDSFSNNLNLTPEEYAKIAEGPDVYEADDELMAKLMDHFSDEMPYGTIKARTGDPHEYIFQELDRLGLFNEGEVEEVHEEENNDLADIIELAGRKSVLGLNQNVTIAESTELSEEDELEEELTAGQKKLPPALQASILKKQGNKPEEDVKEEDKEEDKDLVDEGKMSDINIEMEEEVLYMSEDDFVKKYSRYSTENHVRSFWKSAHDESTGPMEGETVEEEAIEETVEVPLSELADLLRLAGYENYEEKLAEYANEPEEEYFDVEHQLIGLAGGLNRPKTMHPTVAGGDNPMAVIPIKVDEADMFEKIYQNYQGFKAKLHEDPAIQKKKVTTEDLDDFTGEAGKQRKARMVANRQKAKDAGYVRPDGSADTSAYFKSIAAKQDATTAAATEKYWKDNSKGKREKTGNVSSQVMPPSQHTPAAIAAQNKRLKAMDAARTQDWKNKAQGFKAILGDKPRGHIPKDVTHIQAKKTADDPKPYVRTEPMPRPYRKDKKPLPLGDIAKDYMKNNPNAKASRAAGLATQKRAVDLQAPSS